ncbi:MAG: UbiD family decarboxylase domain-containing protein [Chitinispirillaceae bacterium]
MNLRTFISELEKHDLLRNIYRQVDWRFEIGSLTRDSSRALLFHHIKDYPGHSLLTGGLGSLSRIALALGLPAGTASGKVVRTMKERLKKPLDPIFRNSSSALRENRITGSDVDLCRFPVPLWSEVDGGRFIGTWHLNVTKDPFCARRNVGVYRMQLLSADEASVSVSPRSHLAMHMNRAEQRGKSLEMAVCIGVDELAVIAAGAAFPAGVDEYSMAGALARKPLGLVSCDTVDLEVPADSEIVLEGVLEAGRRVKDGPYLDYAGIASSNPSAYVFRVHSIMHRNNPVFRGTSVGVAGAEDHQLQSVLARLGLVDFHGSRVRQKMQNVCLRSRFFRLFQMTGRIGSVIHS